MIGTINAMMPVALNWFVLIGIGGGVLGAVKGLCCWVQLVVESFMLASL